MEEVHWGGHHSRKPKRTRKEELNHQLEVSNKELEYHKNKVKQIEDIITRTKHELALIELHDTTVYCDEMQARGGM